MAGSESWNSNYAESSSQAYFSPKLPFKRPIRSGILPRCIQIAATPIFSAARFEVNLYHGNEIFMHFNPRFDEGRVIVINNWVRGNWQREERHRDNFPFTKNVPFCLHLIVAEGAAVVYVNHRFCCSFVWRNPPEQIDSVEIKGGLDVNLVQLFTRFP